MGVMIDGCRCEIWRSPSGALAATIFCNLDRTATHYVWHLRTARTSFVATAG